MQTSIDHWLNMAEHTPWGKDPAPGYGDSGQICYRETEKGQGFHSHFLIIIPKSDARKYIWRSSRRHAVEETSSEKRCYGLDHLLSHILYPGDTKRSSLENHRKNVSVSLAIWQNCSSQHTKFQSIRDRQFFGPCWDWTVTCGSGFCGSSMFYIPLWLIPGHMLAG